MRVERRAMRAAEENKIVQTLLNLDPYTKFQELQVPTLDVSVTTSQLFDMMKTVPSRRVYIHILPIPVYWFLWDITPLCVQLGCATYTYLTIFGIAGHWTLLE